MVWPVCPAVNHPARRGVPQTLERLENRTQIPLLLILSSVAFSLDITAHLVIIHSTTQHSGKIIGLVFEI